MERERRGSSISFSLQWEDTCREDSGGREAEEEGKGVVVPKTARVSMVTSVECCPLKLWQSASNEGKVIGED